MLSQVAHKYWFQEFLYWLYPRVAYFTVLHCRCYVPLEKIGSIWLPFFRILKWFGDSCGFDSFKKNLINSPLLNNNFKEEHSILWIGKSETTMYTPFCWCTCLYLLYVLPADWDHWSSTHSYIIRRSAERLVYTKLHPADRRTYTSTHSGIKNSGNKTTVPIVIIITTTQMWLSCDHSNDNDNSNSDNTLVMILQPKLY